MASKASAPIVFLLSLSLLFFTFVTSQTPPPPPPSPPPPPPPSPPPPCNILEIPEIVSECHLRREPPILPINPSPTCCNALVGNGIGSGAAGCLCAALRHIGVTTNVIIPITNLITVCNATISAGFTCRA
ncbi:hypothetical protein V6N13_017473 [Hibiscus sabdariffa]|uniref:Hydrophobic seed protein domain-containing protein n=2 Tax=Hibiscus sabdariffa TaxID=183260 RepID=A0ABR2CZI4_9ROSI